MQVTCERPWAKWCGRLIFLNLFTWPILMGGLAASGATDSALQVSPLVHDFGAVQRLGGEVSTTFTVRNQGDTPVLIRRIWTS
jgi:hypothetical protein